MHAELHDEYWYMLIRIDTYWYLIRIDTYWYYILIHDYTTIKPFKKMVCSPESIGSSQASVSVKLCIRTLILENADTVGEPCQQHLPTVLRLGILLRHLGYPGKMEGPNTEAILSLFWTPAPITCHDWAISPAAGPPADHSRDGEEPR